MSDFLFHKVSEQEKAEIKTQAKAIMDSFSKKLESVKSEISEPLIERDEMERIENSLNENSENSDFRKRFFENAPNKNSDFIIAEKKGW